MKEAEKGGLPMFIKIMVLSIGIAAFTVWAQDEDLAGLDSADKEIKSSKVLEKFGISEDSLAVLRQTYKTGNGGVYKALVLSQKSGLTVEQIMQMRNEKKMGWGAIAKELDLKPGEAYKAGPASEEMQKKQMRQEQVQGQKIEKQQEKADKKAEKQMEKQERKQAREKGEK